MLGPPACRFRLSCPIDCGVTAWDILGLILIARPHAERGQRNVQGGRASTCKVDGVSGRDNYLVDFPVTDMSSTSGVYGFILTQARTGLMVAVRLRL